MRIQTPLPLSLPGLSGPGTNQNAVSPNVMNRLVPQQQPVSINPNVLSPVATVMSPQMPTGQNWNGFLGGNGLGLNPWQQHNYQPHLGGPNLQAFAPDADPNHPFKFNQWPALNAFAPDADPNNPFRQHHPLLNKLFNIT